MLKIIDQLLNNITLYIIHNVKNHEFQLNKKNNFKYNLEYKSLFLNNYLTLNIEYRLKMSTLFIFIVLEVEKMY